MYFNVMSLETACTTNSSYAINTQIYHVIDIERLYTRQGKHNWKAVWPFVCNLHVRECRRRRHGDGF